MGHGHRYSLGRDGCCAAPGHRRGAHRPVGSSGASRRRAGPARRPHRPRRRDLARRRRLGCACGRTVGGAGPERGGQDHAAAGRRDADAPDLRRGVGAGRAAGRRGRLRAATADRPGQRRPGRPHPAVRAGRRRRAHRVVRGGRPVAGAVRRGRRPPCRTAAGSDGCRRAGRAQLRDAVRGRAQAGADRACADGRPRAAPARRAGGRAGPRRPRGPRPPAGRPGRRPGRAGDRARDPPRRGDPAGLHARAPAARRPDSRVRVRSGPP